MCATWAEFYHIGKQYGKTRENFSILLIVSDFSLTIFFSSSPTLSRPKWRYFFHPFCFTLFCRPIGSSFCANNWLRIDTQRQLKHDSTVVVFVEFQIDSRQTISAPTALDDSKMAEHRSSGLSSFHHTSHFTSLQLLSTQLNLRNRSHSTEQVILYQWAKEWEKSEKMRENLISSQHISHHTDDFTLISYMWRLFMLTHKFLSRTHAFHSDSDDCEKGKIFWRFIPWHSEAFAWKF